VGILLLSDIASASTHSCGGGEQIPAEHVNDGYCDCEDGSDELQTAACSGLAGIEAKRTFTCHNRGHEALELYPSRVGDGVCDCCDGTDEPKGRCPSTCPSFARKNLEKLKDLLAGFESGLQTRGEWEAAAKTALPGARAEVASVEAEAAQQEVQLRSLQQQLKDARAKARASASEADAASKEDATVSSLDEMLIANTVRQYFATLKSPEDVDPKALHDFVAPQFKTIDFSTLGNRQLLARIAMTHIEPDDEDEAKVEAEENVNPAAGEARKAAAAKLQETIGEAASERKKVEGIDDDEFEDHADLYPVRHHRSLMKTILGGAWAAYVEGAVSTVWDATLGPMLDSDTTRLEKEVARGRQLVSTHHARAMHLKGLVEADLREGDVFHALFGKCFKGRVRDYMYTVCPYGKVEQKSALEGGSQKAFDLGKYEGWAAVRANDPNIRAPNGAPPPTEGMRFAKGESCGGAMQRRADVMVVCGNTTTVISAEEPRACEYMLMLATPAACKPEPLARFATYLQQQEAIVSALEEDAAKQEL